MCVCTPPWGVWGFSYGMETYRSEELWGRDGRAVAVQFYSTSQVKVTDLDWGDLAKEEGAKGMDN